MEIAPDAWSLENRREAVLFVLLCVWMLYEEKGSPWGELSPVGRLRGVGVMYMSYFAVTPLRHRCAMPPLPKERLYCFAV